MNDECLSFIIHHSSFIIHHSGAGMSIKFSCSCGKRLKASDDMAARRIPCPRCGNPVGVPSLDPNRPAPMTPQERLRAQARRLRTFVPAETAPNNPSAPARQVPENLTPPAPGKRAGEEATPPALPLRALEEPTQVPVAAPRPLDPTVVRLKKTRRTHRRFASRYNWPLETHWYECLGYPFRAWPLVLALAGAMALLTLVVALLLPPALADVGPDAMGIPVALASLLGTLTAVAYVCGFLDCVLASATAGESQQVRWPGRDLLFVYRSFLVWGLAFLSVPAPLAVLGFYYWLYCGDLALVDWVILLELGVVGAGYWLLAVLAVSRSGRLRDANPWRVVELAGHLGWRVLAAAGLAGVLILAHTWLAFWTAGVLHDRLILGLLLAVGCWLSWLNWATVLFRVLGIWWYWREKAK
jgi:hypothetical protein